MNTPPNLLNTSPAYNLSKTQTMAPRMDPHFSQKDFIYDLNWGKKVDDSFIDFLSLEARLGHFLWPKKTTMSVESAKNYVCWRFEQDFSYKYCVTKVENLERRYSTFKWILSIDGVKYNPTTNVVTAPNAVWKAILRVSFKGYCHHWNTIFDLQ